jgi:starvation-inducible outer membrane lipoprotein
MKRLSLAIALITSATLLSGCIIVPHRHGHHRGHHHYSQPSSYGTAPVPAYPAPRY